MDTKLVIRLLDAAGELLGWAQVMGHARGDGKIWVNEPTLVQIDQIGTVAIVSVHWCDVNVELRYTVDPKELILGQQYALAGDWDAITCGPAAGGLPPVTIRTPISMIVPAGQLGGSTGSLQLSTGL